MMPFCVYSDDYCLDMGDHVFPGQKYRLVRDRLIECERVAASDFVEPDSADEEALLLAHTKLYLDLIEYLAELPDGRLTSDTPVKPQILKAAKRAAGGTILASRLALNGAVAVNLGGGFHHASAARGEGFCCINDVAVAIRRLQTDGLAQRVFVVDCDLHQGNGTALIFENDDEVFTFSIHEENNYPYVKPPGNVDIGLESGCGDTSYLSRLSDVLPDLIDRFEPDLVLYLAGADPYRDDQLGGLKLTKTGLEARDRFVLGQAERSGCPVCVTLAGGYARDIADLVDIHTNTVKVALDYRARATNHVPAGSRDI